MWLPRLGLQGRVAGYDGRVINARAMVAGTAALLCAGSVAAIRRGVYNPSSQLFGPAAYRGPGHRRSLALTFDDGPSMATPELLAFLAEERIRATFFICGMNALRYPELVREIHEAGHEIGNHSFSHPRLAPRLGRNLKKMNLQSPENIYGELAKTQEILFELTGTRPKLFRPPYGMRWYGLASAQQRLGLMGVLWTVIGHDWEWESEQIQEHVLRNTTPGGIVCLHDGRDIQHEVDLSGMLRALRVIVPAWRAQGYSLETVSDLLIPDAYALRSNAAAVC